MRQLGRGSVVRARRPDAGDGGMSCNSESKRAAGEGSANHVPKGAP